MIENQLGNTQVYEKVYEVHGIHKVMDRWIGKTAVVTGASVGIGASTAVVLADAGMTVVAAARRMDKLMELQKQVKGQGKIICCPCDLSKEEDIVSLFEFTKKKAGGVDLLINNAAVLPTGSVTDCDGEGNPLKSMDECFKINVLGVITATRLAVADMKARKVPGHIIILNSIAGHKIINFGRVPSVSVYATTKHAITALIETMRLELCYTDTPIRMTSLSPGAVDTTMLHSIPSLPPGIPQLRPVDVAEAILYVISTPQHVNISELTLQPTGERM